MSYTEAYLAYNAEATTAFTAVAAQKRILEEAGFTELSENRRWDLKPSCSYYVTRNDSALIAFRIPEDKLQSARIIASHGDAPSFKLKNTPGIDTIRPYVSLNVEGYGGAILSTWFDRPLSIAGRVYVRNGSDIAMHTVDLDKDLCMIPSLAIHMDRDINKGHEFKIQKELIPLFTLKEDLAVDDLIAAKLNVHASDIISSDLFLYNRQAPVRWGGAGEFLSAPRIDDSACAYASLRAITETEKASNLLIHVMFDHEEVGSSSLQGASSTFLADTVRRILLALGMDEEEQMCFLAESFLVSADNGHALHPNYPEKCDVTNRPVLGGGILLKFAGNQKYTTDACSAAKMRLVAEQANIRLQNYHNHSDLPGGSTLGNLSVHRVPVRSADMGIAQLAMHSAYETCAVSDLSDLFIFSKQFYQS